MIPVKDFAEVLSLHAALSLSVVLALLVLYYAISPATDDDNGKLWKNIRLLPDCPRLYQLLLQRQMCIRDRNGNEFSRVCHIGGKTGDRILFRPVSREMVLKSTDVSYSLNFLL